MLLYSAPESLPGRKDVRILVEQVAQIRCRVVRGCDGHQHGWNCTGSVLLSFGVGRWLDLHRVKVAVRQPVIDSKGVNSRRNRQNRNTRRNLLPNCHHNMQVGSGLNRGGSALHCRLKQLDVFQSGNKTVNDHKRVLEALLPVCRDPPAIRGKPQTRHRSQV